jgi:dipeptidyl aminopeptidase/acylaminoacyl peptidase
MTLNDGFDRTVSRWLDEEAGHVAPDYLGDVLARTARTRQRPAWSSLERWLPVQATMRLIPVPRLAWMLLIVLALLAAIGIALVAVGSRPHLPAPFGPARNGALVYGANGDIHTLDLTTGDVSLLVGGPEIDAGPWFARDGSRFFFVRVTSQQPETIALMVADADGSSIRTVVEPEIVGDRHWLEWSPNGDMLVILNSAEGVSQLSIVNVNGEPQRGAINVPLEIHMADWRPGADELIFIGRERDAKSTALGFYAVGTDGTGLRELVPPPGSGTHSGPFSLSHDGRFLAYTSVNAAGHVSSHILDLGSGETRSLGGWFNQAWPTFSPDGERIALVRYPATGATAQAFIGSSGGDGTDVVAIGPEVRNQPGTPGLRIQFSPDGTKLLIVHAAGAEAWVADVATGEYESVALGDEEWVSWQRLAR